MADLPEKFKSRKWKMKQLLTKYWERYLFCHTRYLDITLILFKKPTVRICYLLMTVQLENTFSLRRWSWHPIRVISAPIRSRSCSKCSNTCSKHNLTSSIQWYVQIFHGLNLDFHIFCSAIYDTKNPSLGYWEIWAYHSIELIELCLEQEYEFWNKFLGESQQELLESAANFTYVSISCILWLGD